MRRREAESISAAKRVEDFDAGEIALVVGNDDAAVGSGCRGNDRIEGAAGASASAIGVIAR
jgi:hypothetical protein